MRGRTPVGVRGIVIDLSNVKEPDAVYNLSNNLYIENLKESLKEKETLLKEVHHRVKNNLQIITSILRLHSYNTSDQGLKDILQECYNQVYSMSMLHEKMYRSDTLSDVGADDHIRSLGLYLIDEISARGADVRFLADIDPEIRFSLDKGIPLSLMLNEMITNSLKYAFSGDGPGQISISLQKYNSGNYRLIYSDNGCGLPEDFRIEDSESLGFELITNLAEQLDGKLEIENNGGLKYILIFPVQ
jgi:two-component sensor histidine kinase